MTSNTITLQIDHFMNILSGIKFTTIINNKYILDGLLENTDTFKSFLKNIKVLSLGAPEKKDGFISWLLIKKQIDTFDYIMKTLSEEDKIEIFNNEEYHFNQHGTNLLNLLCIHYPNCPYFNLFPDKYDIDEKLIPQYDGANIIKLGLGCDFIEYVVSLLKYSNDTMKDNAPILNRYVPILFSILKILEKENTLCTLEFLVNFSNILSTIKSRFNDDCKIMNEMIDYIMHMNFPDTIKFNSEKNGTAIKFDIIMANLNPYYFGKHILSLKILEMMCNNYSSLHYMTKYDEYFLNTLSFETIYNISKTVELFDSNVTVFNQFVEVLLLKYSTHKTNLIAHNKLIELFVKCVTPNNMSKYFTIHDLKNLNILNNLLNNEKYHESLFLMATLIEQKIQMCDIVNTMSLNAKQWDIIFNLCDVNDINQFVMKNDKLIPSLINTNNLDKIFNCDTMTNDNLKLLFKFCKVSRDLDSMLCKICCDKDVDHTFHDCGHLVCGACVNKLKMKESIHVSTVTCPFCRKKTYAHKIYFSC